MGHWTLAIVILIRITSGASICRYATRQLCPARTPGTLHPGTGVLPERSPSSALFGNAFREIALMTTRLSAHQPANPSAQAEIRASPLGEGSVGRSSQAKQQVAETYEEFRSSPDFLDLASVLCGTLSYAMAGFGSSLLNRQRSARRTFLNRWLQSGLPLISCAPQLVLCNTWHRATDSSSSRSSYRPRSPAKKTTEKATLARGDTGATIHNPLPCDWVTFAKSLSPGSGHRTLRRGYLSLGVLRSRRLHSR